MKSWTWQLNGGWKKKITRRLLNYWINQGKGISNEFYTANFTFLLLRLSAEWEDLAFGDMINWNFLLHFPRLLVCNLSLEWIELPSVVWLDNMTIGRCLKNPENQHCFIFSNLVYIIKPLHSKETCKELTTNFEFQLFLPT